MSGGARTIGWLQVLYFFFSPHLALCAKCRVCLAWLIKRLLCWLNPKKTFSSCIWLHSFSLMQLAAATKCADLLFCPAHIYKSKLISISGHYLWLYSKQEPNAIHGEFACTITKESTWSIAIHFSSETTFHKRAEENDTAIQSIRFGGKLALFMRFGTFFYDESEARWDENDKTKWPHDGSLVQDIGVIFICPLDVNV